MALEVTEWSRWTNWQLIEERKQKHIFIKKLNYIHFSLLIICQRTLILLLCHSFIIMCKNKDIHIKAATVGHLLLTHSAGLSYRCSYYYYRKLLPVRPGLYPKFFGYWTMVLTKSQVGRKCSNLPEIRLMDQGLKLIFGEN